MRKNIKLLPSSAVFDEMKTPVGLLSIVASTEGLHAICWESEKISNLPLSKNHATILETKRQLSEYFLGTRKNFDLPLVPKGTFFQLQTWQILGAIPYGATLSYGEQAHKLGDKNKARAVGMANSQNPISIIIPCHRVIGRHGNLTGFAGGLSCKAWLLNHEKQFLGE